MDFIERMGEQIGERYLMNKANAAPQQLENLVTKQLKGGAAKPDAAGNGGSIATAAAAEQGGPSAPGLGTSEKDEEIARLRAQLAQTKLEKGAVTAAAKKSSSTGKASTKTKQLEELGAGAGITRGANGRKQLEAPKEMKGLKALGAGAAASKASKGKSESASPSKKISTASRAAKQELPPLSIVARKPKFGKKNEGLATIAGTGAATMDSSRSEKAYGSEASSSLGRRHSVSSNRLRYETESDTPRHTEKPRRSKSVKQPSEDGSSVMYGIAPSRRPARYPNEIAPSRPPPEYGHRKGVNGYTEPSESGSLVRYVPKAESEVGRGETHVIVVEEEEEDVPVRRRSMNDRGGGVVKLSSGQGRTVYMVR